VTYGEIMLNPSLADVESAAAVLDNRPLIETPRPGALQLGVDPLFAHVRDVIAMAARYSVPTIYPWTEFTVAGGLMSYGALILDASRQVGVYTAKS